MFQIKSLDITSVKNLSVLMTTMIMVIVINLLNSPKAFANPQNQSTRSEYILCKLEKEVRTIRVLHTNNGICKTQYTKGGKDQNVGQAKSNSICVGVLASIQKNLETQNWKCKDISQSQVSETSDQSTL